MAMRYLFTGLLAGFWGISGLVYAADTEVVLEGATINSGFSVKDGNNVLISRFSGDGKVGIGTANPTENLEVIGNVKATRFIGDGSGLTGILSGSPGQWTTSGTNISYTAGNVGIGRWE